ncbi:polyprenyl synthetase family protein [Patulibacter defluvii]|uniref:polyprenyl synthetase family protein n=1 Tax=Patulibacter defluvii TaxID=3095358 RepID=UPI002A752B91|nr:farnesyl diphosphate synthase [Patulibacter sp. DM4]
MTGTPSADAAATPAPVYPDHLRDTVERYLEQLRFPARSAGVAGLEEAMRYSLLAGGKRIRPVLALATARALGLDDRDVLPLAAAVELVHTYSLIHDDLPAMDDDDLRRGRPTCHVAYGEDVAILAGDALYAEAFHLLLREGARPDGPPAERVLAAATELADATGVDGMVGGQFLDVKGIEAEGDGDAAAQLRVVHGLKTGRLIGASVGGVVRLAGLDGERADPYRRFATELGVLFQIVDDILDVTGTAQDLGKPQGSDERHGKRTYVTEYGLEGAREMARRHHAAAASALDDADPSGAPDLRTLTDFIHTRTN